MTICRGARHLRCPERRVLPRKPGNWVGKRERKWTRGSEKGQKDGKLRDVGERNGWRREVERREMKIG